MKTVESSAVQPKQWAENRSREDNRKQDNPNLCPIRRQNRTLFEVPLILSVRSAASATMDMAGTSPSIAQTLWPVGCGNCAAVLGSYNASGAIPADGNP